MRGVSGRMVGFWKRQTCSEAEAAFPGASDHPFRSAACVLVPAALLAGFLSLGPQEVAGGSAWPLIHPFCPSPGSEPCAEYSEWLPDLPLPAFEWFYL